MIFETRVIKILDEIIKEKELPDESIYLFSNKSTKVGNKEKEISKSIHIREPEYPSNSKKVSQNRLFVVMNIKKHIKKQSIIELLIRNKQFKDVSIPSNATIKELKSDIVFKHIVFEDDMESLYDYIRSNVDYCVDNYESGSSFGCCSLFEECSNAKQCIHENKLYSKGCSYRRNLNDGKIFYGANRNV